MPNESHRTQLGPSHFFSAIAGRELTASIIVGIFSIVSSWLIKDELKRIIIFICGILVIFMILQLSKFYRFVRFVMRLYSTFYERSHIQHHMIHQLRDICLEILPSVQAYSSPVLGPDQDSNPKPNPQLVKYRAEIVSLLERVVELFQPFVPDGARLWACIRDRRSDNCYYTFERAGRYDPNRKVSSRPLHKDSSQVIIRLKERFKRDGVCVLITGSSHGAEMWEAKENLITHKPPQPSTPALGRVCNSRPHWQSDPSSLSSQNAC
jgi:hypothetical protein